MHFSSLEEAWIDMIGQTMPTPEELTEDPMVALKAAFYAGANAAIYLNRQGVDALPELLQWAKS